MKFSAHVVPYYSVSAHILINIFGYKLSFLYIYSLKMCPLFKNRYLRFVQINEQRNFSYILFKIAFSHFADNITRNPIVRQFEFYVIQQFEIHENRGLQRNKKVDKYMKLRSSKSVHDYRRIPILFFHGMG